MTKIVLSFLLTGFASAVSLAGPISVDQILLARALDRTSGSVNLLGYISIEQWCAMKVSSIDFGTYAAARAVEALNDGIYSCQGEFVKSSNSQRLQIFSIKACEATSVDELSRQCKP